jgi:RNA polymerase sigma factor (sigma-70 family)
MTPATAPVLTPSEVATRRVSRTEELPGYLRHASFSDRSAKQLYDPASLTEDPIDYNDGYMPDDVTREHTKRMHYAAHRTHAARTPAELARWTAAYITLRDRVVLGNRKLIYRAVRRRMAQSNRAEDLIGDCHIVLIQAVAAFNPWMGIRFSTYAYTCLVRALSRLNQRAGTDWLSRSMPLEALPDGEPRNRISDAGTTGQIAIEDFLRDDHPLLSDREKQILTHRFTKDADAADQTLEKVGKALGLSKERVRQVQATALDKLRKALTPAK